MTGMRTPPFLHPVAGLVAALLATAAAAQPAPARPPVVAEAPQAREAEPAVQHIVVEDDNARVDELRVRGETRRITVQPKGVNPKLGYEIVPATGGRDMAPNVSSGRGAAGQRVWSLLSF